MKRAWLTGAAAILAITTGVAWWAVRSVQTAPLHAVRHTEVLPPADYPPDMWEQLARLPQMRIRRAEAPQLPTDLDWTQGLPEEELGDAQAVRGGVVRTCSAGPFPDNLLVFGSPTPQFFHANAFARVEIPLLRCHPVSRRAIPGVAESWAVRGRTVFFRLHAHARYTNGRPIRAADYALGALLRQRTADAGWQALFTEAEELCIYDERTLSLTLRHSVPLAELSASRLLHAAEPGFYAEAGSDYARRYARRVPPTTGAYEIERVETGRLIRLRRVATWWAEDLPLFRHTCNADAIEFHFLTDEAQAWEFLLRSKLDMVQTRNLAAWERYADSRDLVRLECRSLTPQPPYGIALNASRLPDRHLRRGLLHAMDMERAVALLFRGEGERLRSFFEGYGTLTPADTPRTTYDPALARAEFVRAGFVETGTDGILRKRDGTRLSVRLCYVPSEKVSTLVSILRESARSCGAEIIPEPLPWQLCAQKVRAGEHDLTFWATVPAEPLPQPSRYFHSSSTGDEAPFCLRDEEMDAALEDCATAQSLPTFAQALARVDHLVHHLAIWLPGWKENQIRVLHSPRLHFPASPGAYYDVIDNHTLWISPEKEEGGVP